MHLSTTELVIRLLAYNGRVRSLISALHRLLPDFAYFLRDSVKKRWQRRAGSLGHLFSHSVDLLTTHDPTLEEGFDRGGNGYEVRNRPSADHTHIDAVSGQDNGDDQQTFRGIDSL
jgi:hypothetical protein